MDKKKWRLILGTLLFALMFFELCIRAYVLFVLVTSNDGWNTLKDKNSNRYVISRVEANGPARALKLGDELISINNITPEQDLGILIYSNRVPPGTVYKMIVRRENQEITFHLKTIPRNSFSVTVWSKGTIFTNLLFIIVGYMVLLLKPDSKQAWLLLLTLCTFSGLYNPVSADMFGAWIQYPYHLAKVLGIFFVPFFARLFLWFPEQSTILKRYPKIDKYLSLPYLIFTVPFWFVGRLPLKLALAVFSLPYITWLYKQKWFDYFQIGIYIFYLLISICFMFINYRAAEKSERTRLRILMVGSGIATVSFLLVMLEEMFPYFHRWPGLVRGVNIAWLFTSCLIPISFAYAILRHKVIPISIIIRRSVRYVLVSKGAATLVFTIIWVVMFAVMDTIYSYFQISSVKWISALSGIIAILVWNAAYTLYQQKVAPVIDRLFFRENYDTREILSGLQQSIAVVKDNRKLMELVGVAIQKALYSNSISFYVREEHSGIFKNNLSIRYNSGDLHYAQNDSVISQDSTTLKTLNRSKEITEIDYEFTEHSAIESNEHSSSHKKVSSGLSKYRGSLGEEGKSLLVPITTRESVTGMMILGPRLGDLPYSYEDRQMLKSIAGQMSTTLDNIRLIERMIEEERLRREVEAQNEMRAKELEDARLLQLSMLPREVPKIGGVDIAAYMKTAAEVGGDYYDFHVADDGVLTVVIGDATGHGLKAGTVVAATKGLFEAFANQRNIADVFHQSSSAIKRMNLKSLYMTLTMLKIKDHEVSIGVAGMPPVLIYRADPMIVEELDLYGVPLGAMLNYSYRTKVIDVYKGDVILLMTDGLAERFDINDNILGYSEVKRTFSLYSDRSPKDIIAKLCETSDAWGGDRPQDDDITFVVLKF